MACLGWAAAGLAATHSAPWADSFESYSSGTLLQGTNGWSSGKIGAGLVTNAVSQVFALTNTYAQSYAYPLPLASHTNVVAVTDLLDNDILSSSGKVAVLDFTVMPTWCDLNPPDDASVQWALYIKTNQHVVIWQHSKSPVVTNQWLDLGAGTLVNTGTWARFTIVQDYSNKMFQVRVNGADPITSAAGYTAGGAQAAGSWFYMVQTNPLMAQVIFGDGGTNYVDDFVVTNRSLAWSAGGFTESVTNNGSIDHTIPLTVSLRYDSFTDGDGIFAATKYVVGNLPSNLTAVVTKINDTHLSIALTGQAVSNEAINSISDLTFTLLDSALMLGSASSVDGASSGNRTIAFRNTGILSYSTNVFREMTGVSDGAINNSPALTINLTNDLFTGDNGEDYATNSVKLSIIGLPTGLTGQVSKINDTQLQMTLLGKALANSSADSTNLTLTFQAGAFASNVVAANVSNYTAAIAVQFMDAPALIYGTTTFTEKPANDGSVNGTVVAIHFETFAGLDGDDLAGAVTSDLPPGLELHAFRTNSGAGVVLVFSNNATAHLNSDSRLNNVTISFGDAAFSGGNAALLAGASRTDLSIIFSNQPSLALPSGLEFTESSRNNGSIGNSLPVTLTDGAFASDLTGHYSLGNVPAGLGLCLIRDSDTQVTLSLTNVAALHTSGQSRADLRLTFSNEAFSTVAAANIYGSTTNLAVTFKNPPSLAYSRATFAERSLGAIDNQTPLVITLTGDSFASDLTGLYTTSNVPAGLVFELTRNSANQLSVNLTGTATSHASNDTVYNMTLTFQQGAFVQADADQVVNYQTNFSVVFINDTVFINTVPYEEPFETYPNGFLLAGTNGWTADYYGDAAQVTNNAAMNSKLADPYPSFSGPPILTTHTKTLLVRDNIRTEIHSSTGQLVYLDFMMYPVPMSELPVNDATLQYAFYVSTNRQMVIWHRNMTGTPTNEWLTLSHAALVDTSNWTRFTVAQDYSNHLFQLRVDEAAAIEDPAGWSWVQGSLSRTGSWFHMVQTNTLMSQLIFSGIGATYLDDVTVRTGLAPTFGIGAGSIYLIR